MEGTKCVLTCSPGFFGETTTNICDPCNSTCGTCNGPLSNNCLICDSPRYFKAGYCVTDCGGGFYPIDTPTRQCNTCHPFCNTCNGDNINNCLSCIGSRYLLVDACIFICPGNLFF